MFDMAAAARSDPATQLRQPQAPPGALLLLLQKLRLLKSFQMRLKSLFNQL
jgi:hypothetical protein